MGRKLSPGIRTKSGVQHRISGCKPLGESASISDQRCCIRAPPHDRSSCSGGPPPTHLTRSQCPLPGGKVRSCRTASCWSAARFRRRPKSDSTVLFLIVVDLSLGLICTDDNADKSTLLEVRRRHRVFSRHLKIGADARTRCKRSALARSRRPRPFSVGEKDRKIFPMQIEAAGVKNVGHPPPFAGHNMHGSREARSPERLHY